MTTISLSSNFNSIKVRLELDKNVNLTTFQSFQFHKGTIRTREW